MELYVIKGLKNNLLGLPAITSLSLIEKRCTTEFEDKDTHSIPKEILEQFPEVFKGLGTFREEYEIKIKNDATPFALHAPRNVPIPLREKVQKELRRMENLGVIRKVSEPTPWCAGDGGCPKEIRRHKNMC